MNRNISNLENQNNENILLSIVNDLKQVTSIIHEKIVINKINEIIIKMNYFINENKKSHEAMMTKLSNLQNKLNLFKKNFIINNAENQELKGVNGSYFGQVVNGLREGKGIEYYDDGNSYKGNFKNDEKDGNGIEYWNNGDRYEGNFKKGKREGKGIMFYYNGDRYEGNWKNDNREGKGIYYYNNKDRYEGDFKNDKREGKGIFYYNNGDREMGDFFDGLPKGKCVLLSKSGEITINNY